MPVNSMPGQLTALVLYCVQYCALSFKRADLKKQNLTLSSSQLLLH